METPTNTPNADSDTPYPDDVVSRLRAKAVATLPPEIVNSIRALIVTNEEILDRCMESKTDNDDPCATALFTFQRKMFNVVKSRSIGEHTEFLVFPTDEKKGFDMTPLVQLSSGLDLLQPLFVLGCIDFGTLFETSLLLHDDIRLPFLIRLKDHLQLVQVCLGTVEQWVVESRDSKNFLEATFTSKLDDHGKVDLTTKLDDHGKDGIITINYQGIECSNCGQPYESHVNRKIATTTKSKPKTSKQMIVCQRSFSFADVDSDPFSTKQVSFALGPAPTFIARFHILKRIQMDGKLEASFNLNHEHDRAKLIKCLEFVSVMEKMEAK